jgi:hypothetical protein
MSSWSDGPQTPGEIFEESLYSALPLPWKTTRLQRNSLYDQRCRGMLGSIAVAELYHENSKLHEAMLPELMATRVSPGATRGEFLARRAAAVAAHPVPSVPVPEQVRGLISEVAATAPQDLFFAVELRLLTNRLLLVAEPLTGALQPIKQLTAEDEFKLARALHDWNAPASRSIARTALFLVGSFARNEILFGARGYRHTFLEAGRVAERLVAACARRRIDLRSTADFFDRTVDAILEADGIEESTLMAFELMGNHDVG